MKLENIIILKIASICIYLFIPIFCTAHQYTYEEYISTREVFDEYQKEKLRLTAEKKNIIEDIRRQKQKIDHMKSLLEKNPYESVYNTDITKLKKTVIAYMANEEEQVDTKYLMYIINQEERKREKYQHIQEEHKRIHNSINEIKKDIEEKEKKISYINHKHEQNELQIHNMVEKYQHMTSFQDVLTSIDNIHVKRLHIPQKHNIQSSKEKHHRMFMIDSPYFLNKSYHPQVDNKLNHKTVTIIKNKTPIYSPLKGKVIFVKKTKKHKYIVIIKDNKKGSMIVSGISSLYIKNNDIIEKKDILGTANKNDILHIQYFDQKNKAKKITHID